MPKKKPESPEEPSAIRKAHDVRCRFCGQKNAVKTGYKNRDANCGKCKLPLSNEPHKKFADLSKHAYIHPADSKALAALKAIPGVDSTLKKFLAWTGESAIRVQFMASAVKVTPKQCPDLHAKLQIACTTLGVDMPDLYVQQNPMVNAFTGGVEKPIIVLHSALLERLNDEESLAVISHEVGHIHAEHVLYLTAARLDNNNRDLRVDDETSALQLVGEAGNEICTAGGRGDEDLHGRLLKKSYYTNAGARRRCFANDGSRRARRRW